MTAVAQLIVAIVLELSSYTNTTYVVAKGSSGPAIFSAEATHRA